MRSLLSNGAVIFAGIVSVPAIVVTVDAGLPPKPSLPVPGLKADPRLLLLDRFFETVNAPAQAYAHLFLSQADQYKLDWRLLPSISFVESAGGKAARNNNIFGWDSGRAEFPSPSDGIRTVAYHLTHSRFYRGKDLDGLLQAYNPNPEYSRTVKSVMARIAPESIPAN